MYEEQWYGLGSVAPLMNEMNVQRLISIHFDLCLVLRQPVDIRLLFLPVKFILPVCSQSFYISERSAIVPSGIVQFVRELCQF